VLRAQPSRVIYSLFRFPSNFFLDLDKENTSQILGVVDASPAIWWGIYSVIMVPGRFLIV
jgi:hypothetical protein